MYKKKATGWLKHIDFMLWDMVCMHISLFVAYMIRHGAANMYENQLYANVAMVLTMIQIVVVIGFGTLHNVLKRGYWNEAVETIKQVILVTLFASMYLFTVQVGGSFSRMVLYVTAGIYWVLGYTVRILWKKYLHHHMQEGNKRSLLIVTNKNMIDRVYYNLIHQNYEMFHVAGLVIVDEDMEGQKIGEYDVVANLSDVIEYTQTRWVDEVFINLPYDMEYPHDVASQFLEMGIVVHTRVADHLDAPGQKRFLEKLGKYSVITTTMNFASPRQLFTKRCLDIVGGLVGCLITGILCIFLAPAIYLESPGPIFFAQTRIGKNGKKFKLYKFRSMYMDAEERKKELMEQNRVKDGMMFKLEWDPRIIGSKQLPDGTHKRGIGNYIRDWSLDEFPQFYNVLKGDMSLVGTRPPTVDEWQKYELHHRARLAIKPGITGMWQISGRSNITDFEDVVKLDKEYIEDWSIGLDLKILLKTVAVVVKKEGSM